MTDVKNSSAFRRIANRFCKVVRETFPTGNYNRDVFDFFCEHVESRVMLAGNVVATVTASGDLRISGDNASNHIHIKAQVGAIRIEGKDGTLVNGQSAVLMFGVQDDIFISMRGGNDAVQIRGIVVRSDMIIRTSSGDDTVIVLDTQVQNDLEIFTESGNDIVAIGTPDVREDLIVVTSSGNDQVIWNSGQVAVDAVFNLGAGNDRLELGEDCTVGEELDIQASGGNDFVGLGPDDVNLNGPADILLGGGDDQLVLDESNFFSSARILGNGGSRDTLRIDPAVSVPTNPAQFESIQIVNNTTTIINNEFSNFIPEVLARVGVII